MKRLAAVYQALTSGYCRGSLAAYKLLHRNPNALMFGAGTVLLIGGLVELSHAQIIIGVGGDYQAGVAAGGGGFGVGGNPTQACSRVLGYIEGGFGALVATGAGLGAIVAASLGGFKAAWCLLVVSIGCFILRSYLTLFHAGCRAA